MSLVARLGIALLLTANTAAASQAVSKFATSSNKKMEALNKTASNLMQSGTKNIAKGIAIAAPIEAAIRAAADLEDKIADVAKVTNVDFGSKAFHGLEKSAMNIDEFLGRDATAVGELMSELAAGGVKTENLDAMARSAGKIGVAFDVSMGEAGNAFMMIQNAMNSTDEQTMHTMNAMNAATNKFGGKAKELLNFMAQGGASVAGTLKVAGSDMQAFANSMIISGTSSSEAATTMERFQKAILMNDTLKSIFKKKGGGAEGMLAILNAAKKSGNATEWLLNHDVGQYSTKIGLMVKNMSGPKGLLNQLKYLRDEKNLTGSVDKEFNNRQQTTNEQYNKIKVSVKNAAIAIGANLLPAVNRLMTQLKPMIAKVTEWIGKNPKLVTQILKGSLALAGMKIGLGSIQVAAGTMIKTYTGILGPLKWVAGLFSTNTKQGFVLAYRALQLGGAFTKLGSFVSGFGKTFMMVGRLMLTNPIGIAITAIGVAVFLVIKYWTPIKTFFIKIWNWIKTAFKTGVKVAAAFLINFTPVGLIYKHWGKISGWFSRMWSAVKEKFSVAIDFLKNLFLNFTPAGLIIKHWDKIKGFFTGIWDSVKGIFGKFFEWISNTWIGKLIGKIASIPKAIKNVFSFAKDHSLEETVNKVSDVANNRGVGTFMNNAPMLPKLNPSRNTAVQNNFAPVINVNGNSSPYQTQSIKNEVVKALKEHQHQQDRKRFDR